MDIRYWTEPLSEETILSDLVNTVTDYMDMGIVPEECFRTVRETMEEFGYRTAMTYTPEGKPSLYYYTTLKGINCYEVSERSNGLDGMSLPGEEPRLLG